MESPDAGRTSEVVYETDEPVLYSAEGPVAWVRMNRPAFHNAQNSQMTYALDAAFKRAIDDEAIKVIVLGASGKHFSAGHDIGSPGRDVTRSFQRTGLWPDHTAKAGAEFLYTREQEIYLGMCRRWREMPKPSIAMVQGGCIAGGLMLAWVCDLIVASEDAFFQDPVAKMGIPGVEYFAHPFELPPRIAKEFLFLGERMSAERAARFGMVNRVVAGDSLEDEVRRVAMKIAEVPSLALALGKQAINHAEDLRGKRTSMDAAFHMHHFAHAQNELVHRDPIGGLSARDMARKNASDESSS